MDSIKPKVHIEGGLQLIVHREIGEDYRGPVLVGKAGSGRLYYRIWSKKNSLVLMQSHDKDDDFDRFIDCTKFLKDCDLSAPTILGFNKSHYQVLLEDLGDETLLINSENNKHIDENLYFKSLDLLIKFQNVGHARVIEIPEVAHRNFGYLDLLWETEYFYDHFLSRYIRLNPPEKKDLLEFFETLANHTDRHLRTLMHRDFQSQNLMLKDDKIRLIDYQGMRIGSQYYDIGSLLWDPYTQIDDETITLLFKYYLEQKGIPASHAEWERFIEASLQRIMQACGAYGYLSQIMGIREFSKYLEAGYLTLLRLVEHCTSIDTTPLANALKKIDPERLR